MTLLTSHVSNTLLAGSFAMAHQDERNAVSSVITSRIFTKCEVIELQQEVCAAGGHKISNLIRAGQGIPYAQLLFEAAKHLEVENLQSLYAPIHLKLSLFEIDRLSSTAARSMASRTRGSHIDEYVDKLEQQILAKLMVVAYERATPEQRAVIDANLLKMGMKPEGMASGMYSLAALMALGNVGGFTTYMMVSTVLSTLSMGTLGFGAYTFASSLLSVALGPVGWLSLAVYGAIRLGSPNAVQTVRLAATSALISQRLRGADPSGS